MVIAGTGIPLDQPSLLSQVMHESLGFMHVEIILGSEHMWIVRGAQASMQLAWNYDGRPHPGPYPITREQQACNVLTHNPILGRYRFAHVEYP
jgi:hypothetical protein